MLRKGLLCSIGGVGVTANGKNETFAVSPAACIRALTWPFSALVCTVE